MRGRQLTAVGGLVNVGRIDAVGHEAHLAQQFEAARGCGGEHKGRPRHTVTPAGGARKSE